MSPRRGAPTAVAVRDRAEGSHEAERAVRGRPLGERLRALGAPGVVLLGFLLIAAVPQLLSPPVEPCLLSNSLLSPSLSHPLGTDLQGCDYMARTFDAARTSLLIGFGVAAASAFIATVLGAAGGWYGGFVDSVVTRVADILFSVPALLGALVVLSLLDERSVWNVMLVLTVFSWPPMVRLVRGAVRERATFAHVQAALAMGARPFYVLRRHVVPHSLRPMLVFLGPYAATLISAEAVLSFVGAGLQQPTNSWGLMLADLDGRFGNRLVTHPYLYAPGIMLSLLVWALVRISARFRAHPAD